MLITKLDAFDMALGRKAQVVILNTFDISKVYERKEKLLAQLREAARCLRGMTILMTTTWSV